MLSGGSPPPPPSPTTTTITTTTPSPVAAPVASPTPAPVGLVRDEPAAEEVGTQGATITATAALFDPSLSADDGCDPAGCTAALTRVSYRTYETI